MEVKKVVKNKANGQKLIWINKHSGLEEGDCVKIIKVNEEEHS